MNTSNTTNTAAESVLRERVLGPHRRLWTEFVRHIHRMHNEDWNRVVAAADASSHAARAAAREAAREAARATAGTAAASAAASAAGDAAGIAAGATAGDVASHIAWDVAREAARELVGWSKLLGEPFFLKMFFSAPRAWVESVESIDED